MQKYSRTQLQFRAAHVVAVLDRKPGYQHPGDLIGARVLLGRLARHFNIPEAVAEVRVRNIARHGLG